MDIISENNQKQKVRKNDRNIAALAILVVLLLLTIGLGCICIKTYKTNSILEETNAKLSSQLKDKGMYINEIQEQKKELKKKVELLTKEIREMEKITLTSTPTSTDIPNISTDSMNSIDDSDSFSDISSDASISKQTVTLSKGSYTVGVDIQPGIYDLLADSGFGLITGNLSSGFISEAIGISERYPNSKTYSGLELTNGDKFTIKSSVTIKFIPR